MSSKINLYKANKLTLQQEIDEMKSLHRWMIMADANADISMVTFITLFSLMGYFGINFSLILIAIMFGINYTIAHRTVIWIGKDIKDRYERINKRLL